MADSIARKGFDIDLSEALIREEKIARILKHARIEVKSDFAAARTGNFFLEYKCNGCQSGIAITTAPFWIIELPGICYLLIEMEKLKELGRRAYREGKAVKGGDYNKSEGVLIPLDWLIGK